MEDPANREPVGPPIYRNNIGTNNHPEAEGQPAATQAMESPSNGHRSDGSSYHGEHLGWIDLRGLELKWMLEWPNCRYFADRCKSSN